MKHTKENALRILNQALAEAKENGVNLSVARMYGSSDSWAIMVAEEVDYDPNNGGFHVVENVDE